MAQQVTLEMFMPEEVLHLVSLTLSLRQSVCVCVRERESVCMCV